MDVATKRKYIEYYFRKCLRIKGVENAIVFNSLGVPKHSTFESVKTIRSVGLFDDLILKVKRAIHITNPDDQFISIRLRTHKFEIFISKDLDDLYFVIFQNAQGKIHNISSNNSLNYTFLSFVILLNKTQIHTTRFKRRRRRIFQRQKT